jgi:hypothetical protein
MQHDVTCLHVDVRAILDRVVVRDVLRGIRAERAAIRNVRDFGPVDDGGAGRFELLHDVQKASQAISLWKDRVPDAGPRQAKGDALEVLFGLDELGVVVVGRRLARLRLGIAEQKLCVCPPVNDRPHLSRESIPAQPPSAKAASRKVRACTPTVS